MSYKQDEIEYVPATSLDHGLVLLQLALAAHIANFERAYNVAIDDLRIRRRTDDAYGHLNSLSSHPYAEKPVGPLESVEIRLLKGPLVSMNPVIRKDVRSAAEPANHPDPDVEPIATLQEVRSLAAMAGIDPA